jgi:ribosomal protein L9
MVANPIEPPDFEELAQATHTIADNFRRFSNLPAVDGGAAVLAAVQGLQQQMQQMQQMQQQQTQQMQQIQQQMADMEERLAARISARYSLFYSYSAANMYKLN